MTISWIGLITFVNFLLLQSFAARDIIADLSRSGKKILDNSAIPGVKVRQCSCQEQTQCIAEIKTQARQCIDSCWYRLNPITSNPSALRKCVSDQSPLIDQFVGCIDRNLHSCFPGTNGPMIQKQDILKLVRLSEEKIESSKGALLRSPAVQPIQKLLGAVVDFGYCVKDCILRQNAAGFCFDRLGCQPLVREDRARKSLKKCLKIVDWKSKASEFCDCSLRSGITELRNYCPMLKTMVKKAHLDP